MKRLATTALLATLLVATPGCVLIGTLFGIGAVDAAAKAYENGIGMQDFKSEIQEVWQACLEEMQEHHAIVTKQPKLDRNNGTRIELKKGWVEVSPHPSNARFTRVRARFMGTGSNETSRKWAYTLLDGIDARLGGTGSPED